jgi:hypothetical protein
MTTKNRSSFASTWTESQTMRICAFFFRVNGFAVFYHRGSWSVPCRSVSCRQG